MNLIFRVDASPAVGFGHIVRCLSLASFLQEKEKCTVCFVINRDSKAIEMVQSMGFRNVIVPENETEEAFLENFLQLETKSVVLFDNLRDYSISTIQSLKRKHCVVLVHSYSESRFHANLAIYPAAHLPSEFLLDENWGKYKVRLLEGMEYVWLNSNVLSLTRQKGQNANVESVVCIAGGSDPSESLLKLHSWISNNYADSRTHFTFLYGAACNYINHLQSLEYQENISFSLFDVNHLKSADMAICAFGVTTYELIYLNIPTISFGHTEKHALASERLEKRYQCVKNVGLLSEITEHEFVKSLDTMLLDVDEREKIITNCHNLIDGKGMERFSEEIKNLNCV